MLNKATQTIPVLWLFYVIFIPLAKVLMYFRISPNIITTISNILVLLSLYFLFIPANPIFFSICWLLALGFDVCDGMVARKCNLATANGSFYDHTSDQLKLILLFLVIGLKYQDSVIWVISFIGCSSFLLLVAINNTLSYRSLRLEIITNKHNNAPQIDSFKQNARPFRNRLKLFLNKFPLFKNAILGIYNSIFILQGNVMIYLAILSFGRNIVIFMSLYFIFIVLLSITKLLKNNIIVNNKIHELKGAWK